MEDSLSTRLQGNIDDETRRVASVVFGKFEVKSLKRVTT